MVKRKQESFSKIENESFYTSPPFEYRPSIAEYLTTFNVTKNSFIADIMHLDYKGNLKIIEFNKDFLRIKLLEDCDDYDDLREVYDYLKLHEKNNEVQINPNKIPRSVLNLFYNSVIYKANEKFPNFFF